MLMRLGDQVSTVLENARLSEEITLQKTLAETLLTAIPPGLSRAMSMGSSAGATRRLSRSSASRRPTF